ncbi:uncharacterized protein LOC124265002 isoform X4 [Haliotis rubra]|uniref:uncharacterized protein LOC124265002 isoform X4 n=1 Tax=Haliotis rubra TaxID=36100 RepID=UPI001EE5113A|nr:uncharacterized protein LOC124265002 isoform X4 [Haliotis rubra]
MNIRRVFIGTMFIAYDVTLCQQTVSGNRCIEDLTKVFTVQLQCSVDDRIHVVQEVYGDGDAATCRLKSAHACSKLLASSQSVLIVNCNGKQSCREAMYVQTINNCNITDAAAEVKYNCIKGSMNMCSPVTTTVSGSVYLHSPGFPDSVGVNRSCVARITGQNIEVALMEQRMRSGMLNVLGDGRQLWTNVNVNQHNRVLPDLAAEIVIVYDNHDQDGSNVWIRVADSGQMNITISGEKLNTSTTTTSTQQPSQSTTIPSTSDTPTTETAAFKQSTSIDQSTMSETVTRDPTTNTTTALTTPKSTTAVTTPKSYTVFSTNMTTKNGEASFTTTSSPEPGLIIWVASAVSGCVVTILIVVISVVLCRKHVKKSHPLETPGKGHFERPLELSPMNTEKHHNGLEQNETFHQNFVLDPEFGARVGQSLNSELGHRTETSGKNEQDQYAKALPLGSTVDMYDNSTFMVNGSRADNGHQGICGMTENDLYDGGFDNLREAMVDNVAYDKFDFEREKESVQDDSDTSHNNSEQAWKNNREMKENDLYDRGPPCAAKGNHVGDGLETSEGMVDNGLYDKFDSDREKESVQVESDASANNSKQSWEDKREMIENDVYDGGPPHLDEPFGSMADNDNPVGDSCDEGLETSEGMVDNGLYDKFDFDREKESVQVESDASANNSKQSWEDKREMIENDVYDGGPPHLDEPFGSMADNDNAVGDSYDEGLETSEGMVDNGLYDEFDFNREKETVQVESNTSPNNSKQSWKDGYEMIEKDVYDGGPLHLDEPFGSMADNDNPVGDLYGVGLETNVGMVDNGLYDKFEYDREKESLQDESDTSVNKSKLAGKNDCDMVENDVYERGPP